VDISPARLELAKSRQNFYNRLSGRLLAVRFCEKNVFELLESQTFDIVWAMESISHVTPAEVFIEKVYYNLVEHGYLVITDSHLINPFMAWRIYKMRAAGGLTLEQKTISDGTQIPYSHERLLSIGHLVRIIKQAGFRSVRSQLSIYFPPAVTRFPRLFRLCVGLDEILNRIPGLRYFGGIYTVVCRK